MGFDSNLGYKKEFEIKRCRVWLRYAVNYSRMQDTSDLAYLLLNERKCKCQNNKRMFDVNSINRQFVICIQYTYVTIWSQWPLQRHCGFSDLFSSPSFLRVYTALDSSSNTPKMMIILLRQQSPHVAHMYDQTFTPIVNFSFSLS